MLCSSECLTGCIADLVSSASEIVLFESDSRVLGDAPGSGRAKFVFCSLHFMLESVTSCQWTNNGIDCLVCPTPSVRNNALAWCSGGISEHGTTKV